MDVLNYTDTEFVPRLINISKRLLWGSHSRFKTDGILQQDLSQKTPYMAFTDHCQ